MTTQSTYGFLIPTCLQDAAQYRMLQLNLQSIKYHHPGQKIVVIDDHSHYQYILDDPEILVIKAGHIGAGEIHTYWYWYHWKFFDYAIILHDACEIHQSLPIDLREPVKFLWYFHDHRRWHEDNIDLHLQTDDIKTPNDEVKVYIQQIEDPEIREKFLDILENKAESYLCCWGMMSMMSYKFLVQMQEKTKILDLYSKIKGQRPRMMMEYLFSMAIYLTLNVPILGCEYSLQNCYNEPYTVTYLPHLRFHGTYISKSSFNR